MKYKKLAFSPLLLVCMYFWMIYLDLTILLSCLF